MFSYIVKVLCAWIVQLHKAFTINLSFLLHDHLNLYPVLRHSATNQCKTESAVAENTHPNMCS